MLEIINSLKSFFEDNYRRINVREYARIQKISPPTTSKILQNLYTENILKKETDRQYIYYYANKDSDLFTDLSRLYWKGELEKSGIIDFLEKELLNPGIILFGSLAKAESKPDSDVYLGIFTPNRKELDLKKYEKVLKRNIHVFSFQRNADVKNEHLLNNILNGYKLKGSW